MSGWPVWRWVCSCTVEQRLLACLVAPRDAFFGAWFGSLLVCWRDRTDWLLPAEAFLGCGATLVRMLGCAAAWYRRAQRAGDALNTSRGVGLTVAAKMRSSFRLLRQPGAALYSTRIAVNFRAEALQLVVVQHGI